MPFVDEMGDACAVVDRAFTVIYANRAFATLLGLPRDGLRGQSLSRYLPDFATSVCGRACSVAFETRITQQAEDTIAGRHLLIRAQPIAPGVLLFCTDITPRRQFEDELLQSAVHSRMVLEQLPTIHWAVDRDLCFTVSAGAGLRAIGLRPGEVVGRSLFDYFQTADLNHLVLRSHTEALQGRSVRYALEHRGRSYDCALEPLRSPGGEIIGVIGLAHDVTDLRQAEQQHNRLREEAARTTHELERLLGEVLAAANKLDHQGVDRQEAITKVREAASRARDVIGDLGPRD